MHTRWGNPRFNPGIEILILPRLSYSGHDKNREFSPVWYALVVLHVTDEIVKVYVTESNDVIKCHSNVFTIWRTSTIEVTALWIYLRSEMNSMQEKESIMGVSCRQKSPSLAITIWHHEVSLVMPDSDPQDGFSTQLAFYVNLHRAVIGPSATLTGRWRPNIDLRRMLTGYLPLTPLKDP